LVLARPDAISFGKNRPKGLPCRPIPPFCPSNVKFQLNMTGKVVRPPRKKQDPISFSLVIQGTCNTSVGLFGLARWLQFSILVKFI
jgi:hypothetical protein